MIFYLGVLRARCRKARQYQRVIYIRAHQERREKETKVLDDLVNYHGNLCDHGSQRCGVRRPEHGFLLGPQRDLCRQLMRQSAVPTSSYGALQVLMGFLDT